jgi:hypothetical protein
VRTRRAIRRVVLDTAFVSQRAWVHLFHCFAVEWDLRVGLKLLHLAA